MRCSAVLLVAAFAGPGAPAAHEKAQYNRDVRPVFAETCFPCHGPDAAARQANLRLDQREAAIKAGAIAPGKPDASALVERIFSDDPDLLMPPPSSHKTLSDEQKELIERWIAEGAEYQPHWSFIPVRRPALPEVKDAAWARTPIDRFILARLEAAGLAPAPEADRRALARRVSLDLRGLPPSPEEVEAFVGDASPDAYGAMVDRFLASPQWGEHRGRYWLDYARYGDTHGIHFDNYREMWIYRDWVIEAFNRNEPFDQFAIEQLAGDLLPGSGLDQQIATGFNRCNITTNEGGAIAEEYLVLYARDRTETTARVFMGLTANCAVCHDHKYDPLTQREFYQMAAFFNNTTQAAMDGNVRDTPPVAFVPRREERARWTALPEEIAATKGRADARREAARADFEAWLANLDVQSIAAMVPRDELRLEAPPGTTLQIPDAGDFEARQAFTASAWIKLPRAGVAGAIVARMDEGNAHRGWDLWLENGMFGAHLISRWPEDAIKVVAPTALPVNRWVAVAMTYDGSATASGVRLYVNGELQRDLNVVANSLRSTLRTGVPFTVAQRHRGSRIDDLLIHDLRIYARKLEQDEVGGLTRATGALFLARKPAAERSDAERQELFDWYLAAFDAAYRDLRAKLGELEREQAEIKGRGTVAHVMQERNEPPKAHVLFRGEYDKRREEVGPGTPAFLPAMPPEFPRNRLGFARWLLLPEHPLAARTTVNRFWQEVFGTGIVRTSEDLGVSGELPSHPELLEWLAAEFRETGWDVKRLFRLLVTSAAYRQAAVATPEKLERDPLNRLLSRGPRFRMDAEMVRDHALAASGLLVPAIGGPSVKPYQPDGVWEAVTMIGSDTRDYRRDGGPSLYRRSMYTFWKRSAPPASMDIFNAPSREGCVARRERTNTPLQALVTLNDTQFVEAARCMAQAALAKGGPEDGGRLDFIARRLIARPLAPREADVLKRLLGELAAYYRGKPDDAAALIATGESKPDPAIEPVALAAWTMAANAMMNLDEVLNK